MSIASDIRPRKFDLSKPQEVRRLLLECHGFLQTCRRHHHGTDFEGRQFAMEALTELAAAYAIPSPKSGSAA